MKELVKQLLAEREIDIPDWLIEYVVERVGLAKIDAPVLAVVELVVRFLIDIYEPVKEMIRSRANESFESEA